MPAWQTSPDGRYLGFASFSEMTGSKRRPASTPRSRPGIRKRGGPTMHRHLRLRLGHRRAQTAPPARPVRRGATRTSAARSRANPRSSRGPNSPGRCSTTARSSSKPRPSCCAGPERGDGRLLVAGGHARARPGPTRTPPGSRPRPRTAATLCSSPTSRWSGRHRQQHRHLRRPGRRRPRLAVAAELTAAVPGGRVQLARRRHPRACRAAAPPI